MGIMEASVRAERKFDRRVTALVSRGLATWNEGIQTVDAFELVGVGP